MEWIFATILAVLQLIDLVLTGKIIEYGGREVWPTTKWLMARLGTWPTLVGGKLACAIAGFAVAYFVPVWFPLLVLLCFLVVCYIYVCLHNWSVWKNMR